MESLQLKRSSQIHVCLSDEENESGDDIEMQIQMPLPQLKLTKHKSSVDEFKD